MKITITLEDTPQGTRVQFAEQRPAILMARDRREEITPAQLLAVQLQKVIARLMLPS